MEEWTVAAAIRKSIVGNDIVFGQIWALPSLEPQGFLTLREMHINGNIRIAVKIIFTGRDLRI